MRAAAARAVSVGLRLAAVLAVLAAQAAAAGLTEIGGKDGDGPVTVYYPSTSSARAPGVSGSPISRRAVTGRTCRRCRRG